MGRAALDSCDFGRVLHEDFASWYIFAMLLLLNLEGVIILNGLVCRASREAMDKVVEVLLEKETMSGDEFREILSQYVDFPGASEPIAVGVTQM